MFVYYLFLQLFNVLKGALCGTRQKSNLRVQSQTEVLWVMDEERINIEELVQKVDELLSVLRVISGDLIDISKSLKVATKKTAITHTPVTSVGPSVNKRGIDSVKQAFSSELADMLLFEDEGEFIIVKPRRFLGSDNFGKIASIIRNLGGEYVSAGRNSHFKVSREVS